MLREIQAWIDRCKAFLALGEYEISVSLDPNLEELGVCVVDPTYQTAAMALRDPSSGAHPDWERTALHELVHVRMGGALGTEPGTEDRSALERGVEMMTRVLYKMIKGGASQRALTGMARLCARTINTARMGTHRSNMDPGKLIEAGAKIGEIRGREDVPEDVKGMLDEIAAIISEAAGGMGGAPESMQPEKDPTTDPMAPAADPKAEQMYRKILGGDRVDAIRRNAVKIEKAQILALARTEIGAALTPADEKEIVGLSPREAEAYIKGLKRNANRTPPAGNSTGHKAPNTPPVDDKKIVDAASLLKPGEALEKVAREVLETRATTRGLKIREVA